MEGWNAGHSREGKGAPAGAGHPIAKLHPVIAVTEGHRQVPLGGMAVDNHFHQGVLVGRSAAKARYIGYSQH